jgi:hypothetical protein
MSDDAKTPPMVVDRLTLLRLMALLGGLWLMVPLPGCSFMRDQVASSTANTCMNDECRDEQGIARQQCEKECSARYGR